MNDPRVVALLYSVNHGKYHDYSKAVPLVRNEPGFRLEIKNNQAYFELKEYFATENAARSAIEAYIRNWEFDACLNNGPDTFQLVYKNAEIIDLSPTPGVVNLAMTARAGAPRVSASLTVIASKYPTPPSGVNFNDPDVQTMYHRYIGYRQGNEPLPGMAYFCLHFLESLSGQKNNLRKAAAQKYQIDEAVLRKIGELSSKKGGQNSRKADGVGKDFTTEERTFLVQAIMKIIRRAAEKAANPEEGLPEITLSTLSQK